MQRVRALYYRVLFSCLSYSVDVTLREQSRALEVRIADTIGLRPHARHVDVVVQVACRPM